MTARRHLITLAIVACATAPPALAQMWAAADDAGAWHVVREVGPLLEHASATTVDVLSVVRAELQLGRAERAREILHRFRSTLDSNDLGTISLRAQAALAAGAIAEAAQMLARAASLAPDGERGFYHARAGDAYERAGFKRLATVHYANASTALREISGWLAIRQARVLEDPAEAFKRLRRATPPARRLASLARADVYLAAGDTARAVATYASLAEHREAATLALAWGNREKGRAELFEILQAGERDDVNWALEAFERHFEPETSAEYMSLARGYRWSDEARAIEYVGRVVAGGDSTNATLIFYGDLQRNDGRFVEALETYAIARDQGSASAFYRHARLLERVGRRSESRNALLAFAQTHPRASQAPVAVFLVAEARRQQGRRTEADSLYQAISKRWPRAQYAGRSRLRLAAMALTARDTSGAMGWYQEEIALRGQQRLAARFQLARLRQGTGDTLGSSAEFAALAREDSIGYYGMMARDAAGLKAPRFAPRRLIAPSEWVDPALSQLDLLRDAGLTPELDEFVRHLTGLRDIAWVDMLALAEGLSARGWVVEGVRMGWRVAERHTLNDTRVLQVIFPFPLRDLIEREADKHGLDPYLVAGLVRQESAFRPAVVSRAGAVGLMQLMPGTARDVARRAGVEWERQWAEVADANLHLGATHLAGLLKRYGQVAPALAAYNAGGRPVTRWLRQPGATDTHRFIEGITYVETRGYVRTVLRNRELYRALYSGSLASADSP